MKSPISPACLPGMRFALFQVVALAVAVFAETAGAQTKKPEKEAVRIFVIRGGGGYFPNLGTVINQKFQEHGFDVVDFRYHDRSAAAKQIAGAFRDGALPHGVVLIGYSLGGCGVLEVSRALQKENIPVRLLFLIETLNPLQTVPANVRECFNLSHFPAILGIPVRADSPDTKLTNFEAYSDAGLGLEYSHFTMPFVEEVHELIASRLLAAIESEPADKAPAAPGSLILPDRKPTAGEGNPAPDTGPGKKQLRTLGLLARSPTRTKGFSEAGREMRLKR